MNSNQERSIVRNIFTLTTETENVMTLAEKLTLNGVLSWDEKEKLLYSNDEATQCNLLYEIVLRKASFSFPFLIQGLRQTGNDHLANLLTDSLNLPVLKMSNKPRKISQLTKRVSCSNFYEDVLGNISIVGREMGIAEILEENVMLRKNWLLVAKIFGADERTSLYEIYPDFVVKTTLILQDWVSIQKRQATLKNLTATLRSAKHFTCAVRIRNMFEKADRMEKYWDMQDVDMQRAPVSVTGKEHRIILILDDNPSFCLHVERLFLMLDLPMAMFKVYTAQPGFIKNAGGILKVWKEMQERQGTIQNLAIALARNGHPYTAEKLRFHAISRD